MYKKGDYRWALIGISVTVLAIIVAALYFLGMLGFPQMGAGASVQFFMGFALGIYMFDVVPRLRHYDHSILVGIGLGLLFLLGLFVPWLSFGPIIVNLVASYDVLALIAASAFLIVGLVYFVMGLMAARTKDVR